MVMTKLLQQLAGANPLSLEFHKIAKKIADLYREQLCETISKTNKK